jgi:hypothetical protein
LIEAKDWRERKGLFRRDAYVGFNVHDIEVGH